MNQEKLRNLTKEVRIGGKGTPRRKRKTHHKTATSDDKRLQTVLKRLAVNTIHGIEEVNMIKDDGTVIHFNNPKVQASPQANTFAISGHAESKQLTDMLPEIFNLEGGLNARKLAEKIPGLSDPGKEPRPDTIDEEDEDVPDLVEDFDAPSKEEA